jgi:hypothetical protein
MQSFNVSFPLFVQYLEPQKQVFVVFIPLHYSFPVEPFRYPLIISKLFPIPIPLIILVNSLKTVVLFRPELARESLDGVLLPSALNDHPAIMVLRDLRDPRHIACQDGNQFNKFFA